MRSTHIGLCILVALNKLPLRAMSSFRGRMLHSCSGGHPDVTIKVRQNGPHVVEGTAKSIITMDDV